MANARSLSVSSRASPSATDPERPGGRAGHAGVSHRASSSWTERATFALLLPRAFLCISFCRRPAARRRPWPGLGGPGLRPRLRPLLGADGPGRPGHVRPHGLIHPDAVTRVPIASNHAPATISASLGTAHRSRGPPDDLRRAEQLRAPPSARRLACRARPRASICGSTQAPAPGASYLALALAGAAIARPTTGPRIALASEPTPPARLDVLSFSELSVRRPPIGVGLAGPGHRARASPWPRWGSPASATARPARSVRSWMSCRRSRQRPSAARASRRRGRTVARGQPR